MSIKLTLKRKYSLFSLPPQIKTSFQRTSADIKNLVYTRYTHIINRDIYFVFLAPCTNSNLLRNLKLGGGSEKLKTSFGFSLALH